jgi:hypothetical protein
MIFELLGYKSVLPPDLTLPVELVNSIFKEALVRLAEVIVVSG